MVTLYGEISRNERRFDYFDIYAACQHQKFDVNVHWHVMVSSAICLCCYIVD
jgi:hypothetical protein